MQLTSPMRSIVFSLTLCALPMALFAQIFEGTDTLYGNEWIRYDQTYFKIKIAEDGIYKVDFDALANAGFPIAGAEGNHIRLYHNGLQQRIYTSNEGAWGTGDFFEFLGEKNRSELDRHLMDDPDQGIVNPWYSLFNDTAAYYITLETATPALRFINVPTDLTNLPPVEPYVWWTEYQVFNNSYLKRNEAEQVTYSWFNGEGWQNGATAASTFNYTPSRLYVNGPPGSLQIRFACDLGQHLQKVSLHDSLYTTDNFYDWKILDKTFAVGNNRWSSGLKIDIRGEATPNDRHHVAGYAARYSRQLFFTGGTFHRFEVDEAATDKYLAIDAINVMGGTPVAFDMTNGVRYLSVYQQGYVKLRLGPSAQLRRMAVATPRNVTQFSPVVFRNYLSGQSSNYLIITNKSLMSDPDAGGVNRVEEYAEYRRSAEGGGHSVMVADVRELYEQFAYGVEFHPLSIRNFTHFIKKHRPESEYLMFIGKGIVYPSVRRSVDQAALVDSLHFVPMYGYPAADQQFVMKRQGVSAPILAIGRIAVTRPGQIRDYLDKVIEHEAQQANAAQTIEDQEWRKQIIHISGGLPDDQAIIKSYSEQMAQEIENNRYGAHVNWFYKTSNDPIQASAYEQIRSLIQKGVSLWMIYGHSSTFAVDFDIGRASLYENAPRYPYLFIMGCFTGTCSVTQAGLGEDYVLSPKSGAIAYSASVNYSFISALHAYGQQFYRQIGGEDFSSSLGKAHQHTISQLQSSGYSHLVALLHQNVYQGDPAIRISTALGPDYVIDQSTFDVAPNPVSIDQGAYQVAFDLVNLGENKSDSMVVKIEQRMPDNTSRLLESDTIPAPAYRRALQYTLPTEGSQVGYNRLLVSVDAAEEIAELPAAAEQNNQLIDASGVPGADVYFYSNDVRQIWPPNFGIVSKPDLTLFATTSTTASSLNFLFEFDTLETFDSPFKRGVEISQNGGLLRWSPGVPFQDSMVYYWRVARDSLVSGEVPWRSASFVYIPGSPSGWHQSHYGQLLSDELVNLHAVDSTRRIEFADNYTYMLCKVGYRGVNTYPGLTNAYYEGFLGDYNFNLAGVTRGVCLMMHDPNTGHVIWNPANGPYNSNPGAIRHFYYFDTSIPEKRQALMDFIENEIPERSTVGILALNYTNDQLGYDPEHWAEDSITLGKNLFQVFEAQGAKDIRRMADFTGVPAPYGFIFRKNDPNFAAIDTFVVNPYDVYEMRRDFQARWFSGQLDGPLIGPVKSWRSLHFSPGEKDNLSDQAILSLYGVRGDERPDSLLIALESAADVDLSAYSTADFPWLKIRYNLLDTAATRSATQLHFARILYDALPEGAVDLNAHYDFYSDTLERGDRMRISLAFQNLSEADFTDSLRVRYRIENPAGAVDFFRKTIALPAGDSLHTYFELNTAELSGPQRLLVDVNPTDGGQPELFHFNNVAFSDFYVSRDQRNPLLDVTFDGTHIMDGDLISPKPLIIISLKDDNRFLAMTDTALFEVKITSPDGVEQTLSLADPAVQFFPADASNLPKKNQARIEWSPTFIQDGEYRLSVNGRDASDNESSDLDFSVTFQVITRSSLSNLMNYPNPFSTSTCFYYTMTGAETPAHFRLQIMTVSGRIVREVTESEFGPLRAGVHQSEFCWDGKDEFGDQLANGVYLYRIQARKADGTPFEFFTNSTIDGYFKGGWGKMVLMR